MLNLKLNGVILTVATQAEAEATGSDPLEWEYMGLDLYLYGLQSKRDILNAAGLDQEPIDGAVPDAWLYGEGAHVDSRWFVWDYRGGSTFGKPLDLRDVKEGIYKDVARLVLEQAAEAEKLRRDRHKVGQQLVTLRTFGKEV